MGALCAFRYAHLWLQSRHIRVDEVAAALARNEKAIFDQMLIGQQHCVAPDTERVSECPRRGQRLRNSNMTIQYGSRDLLA